MIIITTIVLDSSLCPTERQKKMPVDLDDKEMGVIWEELGEDNYNQNKLYSKKTNVS